MLKNTRSYLYLILFYRSRLAFQFEITALELSNKYYNYYCKWSRTVTNTQEFKVCSGTLHLLLKETLRQEHCREILRNTSHAYRAVY